MTSLGEFGWQARETTARGLPGQFGLAVVVGDTGMSLGVTANAMRLACIDPDWFA